MGVRSVDWTVPEPTFRAEYRARGPLERTGNINLVQRGLVDLAALIRAGKGAILILGACRQGRHKARCHESAHLAMVPVFAHRFERLLRF